MLALLLLATLASAAPAEFARDRETIASLFRRQDRTYPPADAVPDRSTLPQAWLDKLASATIPNIPVAQGTGRPTYPGRQITDPEICSFTYECVHPDDLQTPPAGTLAITFDDGPAGGSDALWKYLDGRGDKGKMTHFMIGSYITRNQDLYKTIAQGGGHIAVHTWSHQYTTTLTNEQVVGELGWSMQIMADLNEGRIPMYWRPPFGDVDDRVRAIAKQVFGLETVVWSHDSEDWNLDQGRATTAASIADAYRGWLADRSRGLNVLHHEVRESQVDAFKGVFPVLTEGWEVKNIADAWGLPWYQNAATGNSTIQSMQVGGDALAVSPSGTSASTTASASTASSSPQSSAPSNAESLASTSSASSSAVASGGATRPSGAAGRLDAPGATGMFVLVASLFAGFMSS